MNDQPIGTKPKWWQYIIIAIVLNIIGGAVRYLTPEGFMHTIAGVFIAAGFVLFWYGIAVAVFGRSN